MAIARAISTEAEVLILDEPTRGLNADDEVTVFAALAKLAHTGDPKHCVIVLTASREIAEAQGFFNGAAHCRANLRINLTVRGET